ncbi:MAG: VCBS repeat-containing protein [Flavobacteriales bacterium]|nr:VCBS repeat-containing protein [Flavobacteriales bacterium]
MKILLSKLFLLLAFVSSAQEFGSRQQISHGFIDDPRAVHCADIDGDGDLDVISASYLDDKIAWMENLGGTFGYPRSIFESADGAVSVHAADFDGDGDIDVVSGSRFGNKLAWYENDGLGNSFEAHILPIAFATVEYVHAADCDGDGDMDILAVTTGSSYALNFKNDGSGNFTMVYMSLPDSIVTSIYPADFDGDGDLDALGTAAHIDEGYFYLAWYVNGGNYWWGDEEYGAIIIGEEGYGITSVFAEDFDGDGDMDAVCINDYTNDLIWYKNDGNGDFTLGSVIDSGSSAVVVHAADLDGDGDIDIITNESGGTWYQNNGNGNFSTEIDMVVGGGASDIHSADLDGDGDIDVLVSTGPDKIALYDNQGSGNFIGPTRINPPFNSTHSVYAADLDGDADIDVLSASGTHNTIGWYTNDGSGQFSTEIIVNDSADNAKSVYAADLDGDGDLDVLSASKDDDKVAWYMNNGSGNFSSENIINSMADGASSVYSADLDGDGDLDVISASYYEDMISWYENDGLGNFSEENVINSNVHWPNSVFAADVDNDGDIDVLSAASQSDKVAWYENDGAGNFISIHLISATADLANSVFAADLDEDGDMDVLTATGSDDIIWYENDGLGTFTNSTIINDGADLANSVFACDLDNDGDIDVLSTSANDFKLAWYENSGSGVFSSQKIIDNTSRNQYGVFAADLDGDGDKDVVSASFYGHGWYENNHGLGCIDSNACNFNPNAWVENGSCCYENCGCTNPLAGNYLESATCDNGFCEYEIVGTVFFDQNENGVMDGDEYGLPFQTVVIEALNLTYITNDQGNFISNIGQEQIAIFELMNTDVFPYNTTQSPQIFDAETAESTNLFFGVSNEQPDFAICIDLYPNGNGFLCNDYSNHNICFRNMGNVPIDGILEIEYDQLFQGHQEVTPIDSVNGNTVYMSFENLLPGQMYFYDISLLTPTVDHIGEFVSSYARIYGFYEGEQVAFGEEELTMEITCAYDPNDKQAFPLGYTDEHWLLQETEQEFLIRFQNTGNAPAQNIRIQDTLDVNFDISSFKLIANSHSVITLINPETRLIDFYFENIQLPDSVNNEPDSHGLISYKITPLPNLPGGTVLENTAYIYFDNNDPIITNTTWTTIHECGGEAAFLSSAALICNEPQVNFESSYEFVEQYAWTIDDVETGVGPEHLLSSIDLPEYEVTLTASNPLCTETNTLLYTLPDIAFINPCLADLNCDGNRDSADFLTFLNEFGCQNDCEGDLDANAIVNIGDLIIFLSKFGESCW